VKRWSRRQIEGSAADCIILLESDEQIEGRKTNGEGGFAKKIHTPEKG